MEEATPRRSADNIGKFDRTVRVFGGIILLYMSQDTIGATSLFIEGLGFYGVLTGFLGTCFLYHIFNFRTKK